MLLCPLPPVHAALPPRRYFPPRFLLQLEQVEQVDSCSSGNRWIPVPARQDGSRRAARRRPLRGAGHEWHLARAAPRRVSSSHCPTSQSISMEAERRSPRESQDSLAVLPFDLATHLSILAIPYWRYHTGDTTTPCNRAAPPFSP